MMRPKISMFVAMGMLVMTALLHVADTPAGVQAQQMAPSDSQAPSAPVIDSYSGIDGVSADELFGAQVGDTLSDGSVITNISETSGVAGAECQKCGRPKAKPTGNSPAGRSRRGRFKTERGEATNSFMRRGPVRRSINGARAEKLQRIADSGGLRSSFASRRLERMAARGTF